MLFPMLRALGTTLFVLRKEKAAIVSRDFCFFERHFLCLRSDLLHVCAGLRLGVAADGLESGRGTEVSGFGMS